MQPGKFVYKILRILSQVIIRLLKKLIVGGFIVSCQIMVNLILIAHLHSRIEEHRIINNDNSRAQLCA